MRAESLIWEEYRDEVGRRIVILPAGSMEQHGPHLPLNVDVVIPTNLGRSGGRQDQRSQRKSGFCQ